MQSNGPTQWRGRSACGSLGLLVALTFLAGFLLGYVLASTARADEIRVSAGASVWPDWSNNDELESGNGPAPIVGLGYLRDLGFATGEIEVSAARETIHGVNIGGPRELGDESLYVVNLSANVWRDIYRGFYAGGGIGALAAAGLGDTAYTPTAQFGGGYGIDLTPRLSLDLRYTYLYAFPVDLAGGDFEYDSHRAMIGLRIKLGDLP